MALTIRQQYEADQAAKLAAKGNKSPGSASNNAAKASLGNALKIATAFAELSAKSAQAANAAALRAAKSNIKAGTAQLQAAESDEKRKVAQALAKHQGTLRVNSAYRGTASSASTQASSTSATIAAGREAANISANTAAQIQRLITDNNPQLVDVRLAAIQGGLQGFSVGSQLASSLSALGTSFTTPIKGGGDQKYGGRPFIGGDTFFSIPGLDLGMAFKTGKLNL